MDTSETREDGTKGSCETDALDNFDRKRRLSYPEIVIILEKRHGVGRPHRGVRVSRCLAKFDAFLGLLWPGKAFLLGYQTSSDG